MDFQDSCFFSLPCSLHEFVSCPLTFHVSFGFSRPLYCHPAVKFHVNFTVVESLFLHQYSTSVPPHFVYFLFYYFFKSFLITLIIFSTENEDTPIVSSQRSAVDFGLMILCHVDKNPLDYNGYGCFCGLGGKGEPKDDTDRYHKDVFEPFSIECRK